MNTRGARRPQHPELGEYPYFVTTRTFAGHRIFQGALADVAVSELIIRREQYGFLLMAYVFMPDHAHFVLVPARDFDISQTMRVVKGGIARAVNATRGMKGAVWQDGFYDRAARGRDDLNAYIEYVHQNPVRGGLVSTAADYRWSSVADEDLSDYHRYLEAARA